MAVVRVSGPDAFAVGAKVSGHKIDASLAGTFFHAKFVRDGKPLDDGLVLVFAAPKSYTGEDAVEFHTHGGSVAPRRVLEAALACGARIARRGEFTERAFLNGKLDLTAAEAVIDLVDAKTERAADEALGRLGGASRRDFEKLYKAAIGVSSDLEFALDISEDELPPDYFLGVAARMCALSKDVVDLTSTFREGKILREGALVVLAGAPNAGKSSLMNALLRENRAIVSDVAGTTRDSIEEWLDVEGWPVRLVDTAGLRASSDKIEAEGVSRSEDLIKKAELVVALSETGDYPQVANERVVYVRSKSDLLGKTADGRVAGRVGVPPPTAGGDRTPPLPGESPDCPLPVSSKTGEGIAQLRAAVVSRLEKLAAKSGSAGEGDISSEQYKALLDVIRQITDAMAALGEEDLLLAANHARAAAETIGRLVGKTYTADLLDSIFSRFCVGK